MENFPDKISPMTLAAAMALGEGGGGQPSGEYLHYAGSIAFSQLPALDVQKEGFVYDVTDGFTSTADFTDGGGKIYSAGTNVAIVNRGTVETPVMKYDCMSGDFSNFVVKEPGKSLSTNDYTDADKVLVQDSPITATATGSDLTLSTSSGSLNGLTVYGKSEVVDGTIKSAGEGWATVDLGTLNWSLGSRNTFYTTEILNRKAGRANILCGKYQTATTSVTDMPDKTCRGNKDNNYFYIRDTDYNSTTDFINAMSGIILDYEEVTPTNNTITVKTDNGTGIDGTMATFSTGTPLRATFDGTTRDEMHYNGITGEVITRCEIVNDEVVPLATPITTPLTQAENDSIAGLRTFEPQTHVQNNAQTEMTVEAYAGTANGQAVNELKQDVQSEISALKITQSDTLTLTVVGWSSNQQSVTYTHDTAKRNVIDVDPASVEEWASCGVLATSETASGITFTCKAVPTNALTFRVTSMGV